MYRCRYCGSDDIYATGTIAHGEFEGKSPKEKGGLPTYEILDWSGIDTWICGSCRKESEDLDDLAEWSDEE